MINGRALVSEKIHRAKKLGHLQAALSGLQPGSRRYKQRKRSIARLLAKSQRRIRDANHKVSRAVVDFGSAVQLAARVCDRAEPGQVLVPQVVRDLCRGKTFTFDDQGEATLKGFPEPVRLFVVGKGA